MTIDYAAHYPKPEAIKAFADFLAARNTFQGEDLAEAYYDWKRDGALLYEGDRNDDIEAAWAEMYPAADDEEETDVEGWKQWVRFTVMELALLELMARAVAADIAAQAAAYGAYPILVA